MLKGMLSRFASVLALAGIAVLAGPGASFASPPDNDAFANAILVEPLPFTDAGEMTGTSTEFGEFLFSNCDPYYRQPQQTVWYKLVSPPSPKAIKIDVDGSDPEVIAHVWQSYGGGLESLYYAGCTTPGGGMQLTTQPGTVYYLQVSTVFVGSAHVQVNVGEVPPPVNDAFVNATTIGQLAYVDTVDMTAATLESGEPTFVAGAVIAASAWYKFTPDTSETLMARASSWPTFATLAVYTGPAVDNLHIVHTRPFGEPVAFQAVAGTTYYFQVGRGAIAGTSVQTFFTLEVAPDPYVSFFTNPPDASIYDPVQFQSMSFDPAYIGIASWIWDFGDGTGGSGTVTTHRYTADGDYTAALTVTTTDGRSASFSQLVGIRTHDVSIVKLTVPNTARAGQTREITASVRNVFNPETVQFQLFKSVPGIMGFQLVGTLAQLVPVAQGNKTVPVTMSYTFSGDDAAVGKVTFQVIAQVLGPRDAAPADNTAIASPTRVSR